MKIYHTSEPFDNQLTGEPSQAILRMEANAPEVFDIFLKFQEALVAGTLKRDGIVCDDTYDALLPVAAQLTMATAMASQHPEDVSPTDESSS